VRSRRTAARALGVAAALLLAVAAPAVAQDGEELSILAGNSQGSSTIDVLIFGPPSSVVDIAELVDGVRVPVISVATSPGTPDLGTVAVPMMVTWRCDRRSRDFVATATGSGGRQLEDWSGVRTPSCDRRFKLGAPAKARPGSTAALKVTDSWRLGDIKPKLCVAAPKAAYRCRIVGLREGRSKVTVKQRFGRKGVWKVQLRGPTKRITNSIAVGVKIKQRVVPNPGVLLLGDSLMSNLVTPITDRLGTRVNVFENLVGGSGLTDATYNWVNAAKRQLKLHKPKAAAMLIGGGDGFPLTTADGTKVNCCGDDWSTAYSVKVARMMTVLRNGGKTKVVWILNPAMKRAGHQSVIAAINRAARIAQPGVAGVKIVDLGQALTPGGFYAESIDFGGKSVRVRQKDGVHMTVAGADIASRPVVAALKPLPR
jgi:lysophospholipase L1-like esterase